MFRNNNNSNCILLLGTLFYMFTEVLKSCPQNSLVPLNMCRCRSEPETQNHVIFNSCIFQCHYMHKIEPHMQIMLSRIPVNPSTCMQLAFAWD
jgi:hypothetical protein